MNLKTTPFPFRVDKFPFFYGWIILLAGTTGVVMSIPGQTMGVSVFTDYLVEALNIQRTNLSLAYMVGTIASGLLITKAGKYYDQYGARIMAMFAGLMLGLVLFYLSRIDRVVTGLNLSITFIQDKQIAIGALTLGFFGIRFFGQGILTMVSRNMVMKWFEAHRGLANAIMGVFISFGFSYAPRLFNAMIERGDWHSAWQEMAIALGVVFVIFAFVLFRDNAKDSGLRPDGNWKGKQKQHNKTAANQDYTLKEALHKYSFWIFNLGIALHALFVTAITFHIVSIFEEAGFDRTQALSIFLPSSFIAVGLNFAGGWLSDYIKLKYILMMHLAGILITSIALIQLSSSNVMHSLLIIGFGICSGVFSIINTVTWPRFFGTKHLGSISGFSMSWTVIASAIGPYLFSLSLNISGSYTTSIIACIIIASSLFILAFRANNVQN